MAKWEFEPGHTAVAFRARHMMVTWVRGHFKDVHGTLDFDPANPQAASVDVTIGTSPTFLITSLVAPGSTILSPSAVTWLAGMAILGRRL